MSSLSDEVTSNLGALLLGNIADAVLVGVTTVQTYAYWNNRGSDCVILVVLLSFSWIINLLQLILFTVTTYTYAITDFANPIAAQKLIWTFPVLIFLTGASDLIVRSIFSHRVWKLSNRNMPLTVSLLLCGATITALSWTFAGMSCSVSSFDSWRSKTFAALLYSGLSSAVVGDLLIAGSLCVILTRHLMNNAGIETGALTSACTLACLITYATRPHTFAYVSLYLLLTKFSLNALLATLNARRGLRAITASPDVMQPSMPAFAGLSNDSAGGSMGTQQISCGDMVDVRSNASHGGTEVLW
ncbi:uncharacterized protein C8Q71DRAFT_274337 [Rhodofomes roseus]|uniref:DUF6534 domain-containing protein n=1 Tax=Rhodofomes roseus TaxID=34475 RepID=A0ABQ8K4X9_9APHY|nr:uncharacterized protein C8Q71DRAFT_274337 [Rhodofomes roseus]KAH9831953.1 hypothetical protein C8Q71DRAFT_274337 [Rhodofomes roseus]